MRSVGVSRYIVPAIIATLVCVSGVQAYLLYRLSADAVPQAAESESASASDEASEPWLRIQTSERPRLLPAPPADPFADPLADPFAGFEEMQRRMDAMFERAFRGAPSAGGGLRGSGFGSWPDQRDLFTGPAMTFQDLGDHYEVVMPIDEDMHPEVQVRLEGRNLSIEAVMSSRSDGGAQSGSVGSRGQVERSRRLSQSVYLPQPVDESSLEVTTEDGQLRVTIDKQR